MRCAAIAAATVVVALLLAGFISRQSNTGSRSPLDATLEEEEERSTHDFTTSSSTPNLRNGSLPQHHPVQQQHNNSNCYASWIIGQRQRRKPRYFQELSWEPACPESFYDYVGTLYFCSDDNNNNSATEEDSSPRRYGYQLQDDNGSCHLPNDDDDDEMMVHLNPLIRVQPGIKYRLRLVNLAAQQNVSTNLHVHGIYLSGSGNADNVFRSVEPGYYMDYNWTIPQHHMDGSFVYHAHEMATKASCQINGGAYGIFLVDPPMDANDDNHDNPPPPPPALINRQRLLLLTTIRHAKDGSKVLYHAANGVKGRSHTANDNKSHDAEDDGQVEIELQANAWHRLRVFVMDATADIRRLRFDNDNHSDKHSRDEAACQVHAAAYDGVWRSTVPAPQPQWEYNVTGATRIDFAIKCQRDGALWYFENDSVGGGDADADDENPLPPLKVVLKVITTGGAISNEEKGDLLPSWTPRRPDYLQSLIAGSGGQVDDSLTAIDKYQVNMTPFSLNGLAFSRHLETPWTTIEYGSVQEWKLQYTQYHPFHLHVFHMQVVSPEGCGNIFEVGEWYDTISALDRHYGDEGNDEKAPCLVRFAVTQAGRILFHCHTMEHFNAMGWAQVTHGGNVPDDDSGQALPQQYDPASTKASTCNDS